MTMRSLESRTVARAAGLVGIALAITGCASSQAPASLREAESLYNQLANRPNADQLISGDLLRAREAINGAQVAATRRENGDYVAGMSHIALRTAQEAQANYDRLRADAAADSLRRARLTALLSLSEAQRSQLLQQQQLSEAEIAALRERNLLVTQQAAGLSRQADSLRMANEEANRRLNDALGQLRTLVTEITNLRETSRGIVISLSDILFDVNQSTLKAGAAANIARISTVLRQYSDKQIAVEGHTDSDGPDQYNQDLSQRRAAAVREALVAGGVTPTLITSRGLGETQPVATNATAVGKQQNRRVEIVVLGAGSMATSSDTTRRMMPPADSARPPADTTQRPPR
jgi:outer membrane protein OmpA-like peptidoglycan-associated protein